MGSALLVAGSLAYSGYCALAVQRSAAEGLASNQLYLSSSLLWLLGTAFLIHSSYPERVAGIVTQAERDARDPSRLAAMGALERYATSSSLLLGAWNLGLGAPTFLAGAVLQTAAHPADDMTLVAYAYDLAGVYLFVATGLLVLGALPHCPSPTPNPNPSPTPGQVRCRSASRRTRAAAAPTCSPRSEAAASGACTPPTTCWRARSSSPRSSCAHPNPNPSPTPDPDPNPKPSPSPHPHPHPSPPPHPRPKVGCLVFGVVDLLAEPSTLTLCFALSQLPFAAGGLLLARSTYPDGLNRASVPG